MRSLRWLAVIAVLGLGVTIGVANFGGAAGAVASPPSAPGRLSGVEGADVAARLDATAAGEAAPTNVQIAKGNLRGAMETLDPAGGSGPNVTDPRTGRPFGESPVYVVTMDGHFSLNEAHVPRGQSLPEGSVMEVVVDALSESVISRHVQSAPAANLRPLGAVTEG
jgi:hypothetical protein